MIFTKLLKEAVTLMKNLLFCLCLFIIFEVIILTLYFII